MQSQDIKDVLALRDILTNAEGVPDLIASIINWRDGTTGEAGFIANQDEPPETVAAQPDSEPEPPTFAPKPKPKPAKAAAKGRAKPPASAASDDDADF